MGAIDYDPMPRSRPSRYALDREYLPGEIGDVANEDYFLVRRSCPFEAPYRLSIEGGAP